MPVKLEKVAIQIKNFAENLTFSGLVFINRDSIKEIELYLQQASKSKAYRLATSLRYLHIELKRFLSRSPAFSKDRYAFFLCNCWLLSRAFLSGSRSSEKGKKHISQLMGSISDPKLSEQINLRLVGIEKVNLEGTMFGLIFFFISLLGKNEGSVLKWSLVHPPKGIQVPEILLSFSLKGSKPQSSVEDLLYNEVYAEKIPISENEGIIFLNQNSDTKIYIKKKKPEEGFPTEYLEKFDFSSQEIYKMVNQQEVNPFDAPKSFLDYVYLKNVSFLNYKKEGKETYQTPVHVFQILHEKTYSASIRIPDKPINLELVDYFKSYTKSRKPIDGVFCKLMLEKGNLSLFPLNTLIKNKEYFPMLSKIRSVNNKDLLKQLYKN